MSLFNPWLLSHFQTVTVWSGCDCWIVGCCFPHLTVFQSLHVIFNANILHTSRLPNFLASDAYMHKWVVVHYGLITVNVPDCRHKIGHQLLSILLVLLWVCYSSIPYTSLPGHSHDNPYTDWCSSQGLEQVHHRQLSKFSLWHHM